MIYGNAMTFDHLLSALLQNVPDDVDKREGSVIYDALAPIAAELCKAYLELDVVLDETFVDTASLYYLEKRCRERGVPIKEATNAVVGAAVAPEELPLPDGARFACDGQSYVLTGRTDGGLCELTAETPGAAGNLHAGALTPLTEIDGLQTARITGLLIPGGDGDDAESLRARYFASLEGLAFGGNRADYLQKVGLMGGVGGAKVFPAWQGGGTVKITVISAQFDAPSETLIRQVQQAFDPEECQGEGIGLAPIGHTVTVTGARPVPLAVATRLTFAEGFSWDNAEAPVRAALDGYFAALCREWADTDGLIVRVAQIENHLLSLPAVLDVADTTIDDAAQNKTLGAEEIPVLGAVTVL